MNRKIEWKWLGVKSDFDIKVLELYSKEEIFVTETIKEAIQEIANASLLVAHDSAAAHFASLVNTPTVTLFSAANEDWRWAAVGNNVVLKKYLSCSPCFRGECPFPEHPCMRGITPREVAEQVISKLKTFGL